MEERVISQAVISRLPRYYRYLGELIDEGVERISSQELSRRMNVTASQIRQDFNNFGGFGQQGYGYNTGYLYNEIAKILGLDHEHTMVLVGVGNLGQAILGYMNFKRRGFVFRAAFDIREEMIGRRIGSVQVYDLKELEAYIRKEKIEIAVLTLPREPAVNVAQTLCRGGIRAIWNFAHVDLQVPEGVQVENVHLSESLMKLSYRITDQEGNVHEQ